MFAKRGCRVTVAERNSEVTYSDPDRSYVYAIDGRGRQFTDKYDITPKLADASVDALDVSVTRVFPNGKSVTRRQVIKDERRLVYWLPRSRWAAGTVYVCVGGGVTWACSSGHAFGPAAGTAGAAGRDEPYEAEGAATSVVGVPLGLQQRH